jgi:hypothetical protein
VTLWFAVFEGTAAVDDDGSFFRPEWTHPPASRASVLLAELVCLQLRRRLQRSRQQATHGRQAHVLHLSQIDVQAGALVAPVLAHDDFSPAPGQFLDALEIFRA